MGGKVKSLIESMLAKLQEEASADATEKEYCDDELAKTATKKDELNADISKLSTGIDQASARSVSLKAAVKELQSELATLDKEQAENDKWRQDTHADYLEAKSDLELGLDGVKKALVVLRDYYAQGAALLQQPAMPAFEKATGSGTSIIGILETVESDFATNLAKVETDEASAVDAYEKFTEEYKITKAKKSQDVKYKTQEFTSLDKSIGELSSDKETTNNELAAVLEYDGKLKARCIAKPETFQERSKRRADEIAGLKEALSILESEVGFVQRSDKRRALSMRGSLTVDGA